MHFIRNDFFLFLSYTSHTFTSAIIIWRHITW